MTGKPFLLKEQLGPTIEQNEIAAGVEDDYRISDIPDYEVQPIPLAAGLGFGLL